MRYLLDGKVVPKKRPRFNSQQRRAYHDPAYADWLETATWVLRSQRAGTPTLLEPVLLHTVFDTHETKVLVEPMLGNEVAIHFKEYDRERPTGVTGDLDNLVGSVMDALTKARVWEDDKQVAALIVTFGKGNSNGG